MNGGACNTGTGRARERPVPRQPLPDVLRALAMLSVLTVNAAGYLVAPWGPSLGEAAAAGADLQRIVQFLMAALLQGKGYPMLAFVFGMGLWLSMRGHGTRDARARALARQRRLRGLGVVHGLFVYFGDILTLYGLVGSGVLVRCREPWRSLRARIRRAAWWALGAVLAPLPLFALWGTRLTAPGESEPTLADVQGWLDFWVLNAQGYGVGLALSVVFAWPVVRLCMWCGVATARLRLLTHPRWHAWRWRWTRRVAPPLLGLNLGLAWLSTGGRSAGAALPWAEVFASLAGLLLAAVYLLALSLAAREGRAAWARWIAPLGTRTLTLYVGHGVLCAVLFSGAGLALRPGSTAMALFSVALWSLALLAARASGSARWPLEAWLARRRRS